MTSRSSSSSRSRRSRRRREEGGRGKREEGGRRRPLSKLSIEKYGDELLRATYKGGKKRRSREKPERIKVCPFAQDVRVVQGEGQTKK